MAYEPDTPYQEAFAGADANFDGFVAAAFTTLAAFATTLTALRAHMRRCGRPEEEFVALVGARWIAAWERLDRGTYSGFAADLDHVCAVAAQRARAAAREGARSSFCAVQWRGALIAGSIVALNGELPLAVVGALLERGVWSPAQAVAYASRLGDESQRLRALLAFTGWFEPAYQPLAVSAAATVAAAVGATSAQAVSNALRDLAIGGRATGASAAAVARVVVGVALVSHQLSEDEGRRLRRQILLQLERDGDADGEYGLAAEQRIEAAFALVPYLPEHAEELQRLVHAQRRRLVDVAIRDGGVRSATGEDPGPVWLLDRFRQLCDAVHDDSPEALADMAHGALIMVGFLTRYAAFLASGEMAVAYFLVHQGIGPLPIVNMGERSVLFCFSFLYMAARGSGSLSVDGAMGSKK